MIILIVVIFALLVLMSTVRPHQSIYSKFELDRRAEHGGSKVERELLRHQTYAGVEFWLHIKETLLVIALVLLLISTYDLTRGLIFGILAIFGYTIVARMPLFRRLVQKLYGVYEMPILHGVQKLQPITKLLHGSAQSPDIKPASREELDHVMKQSSRFFEQNEYEMVKGVLEFGGLTVRDCMIARDAIDSVAVDELLGPLVLNDLHKTGHNLFPVIEGDIDHIVGVLDVQDLLVVGDKKSPRVKNVMDSRVCYLHEDQTLGSALEAFVKTKRNLLIVINDTEETAGLLSLADVIKVIMGSVISDEFEEYDDLRAVASRNYDDI